MLQREGDMMEVASLRAMIQHQKETSAMLAEVQALREIEQNLSVPIELPASPARLPLVESADKSLGTQDDLLPPQLLQLITDRQHCLAQHLMVERRLYSSTVCGVGVNNQYDASVGDCSLDDGSNGGHTTRTNIENTTFHDEYPYLTADTLIAVREYIGQLCCLWKDSLGGVIEHRYHTVQAHVTRLEDRKESLQRDIAVAMAELKRFQQEQEAASEFLRVTVRRRELAAMGEQEEDDDSEYDGGVGGSEQQACRENAACHSPNTKMTMRDEQSSPSSKSVPRRRIHRLLEPKVMNNNNNNSNTPSRNGRSIIHSSDIQNEKSQKKEEHIDTKSLGGDQTTASTTTNSEKKEQRAEVPAETISSHQQDSKTCEPHRHHHQPVPQLFAFNIKMVILMFLCIIAVGRRAGCELSLVCGNGGLE